MKDYIFKFIFVLTILFGYAYGVSAATLNISPRSATHAVGDTFSVNIVATSPDQAINAADGTVSFPTDKLSVDSISKDGSIFNIWTEEPDFSNSTGKVDFSGVILNPGYKGSSGKILKINFRVKKSGNAAVMFSSGSILANDGMGTNILSDFGNGQFAFIDNVVKNLAKNSLKNPLQSLPSEQGEVVSTSSSDASAYIAPPYVPARPLISAEFLTLLKRIAFGVCIGVLLLLVVCVLYFIAIYTWHKLLLLRIKQKNEAKEVIAENKISEMEYLLGQANARVKHQESLVLSLETNVEVLREENKKAVLALHERETTFTELERKFTEVSRMLEEERITSARLAEALKAEKDNSQKLADVERNRDSLTIELSETERLLNIEKTKHEEAAGELQKLKIDNATKEVKLAELAALLSEAKTKQEESNKFNVLFDEQKKELEKNLTDAHQRLDMYENKLATVNFSLDDAKKKLADEQSIRVVERTKYEAFIEESKKRDIAIAEKERKLAEFDALLSESKAKITSKEIESAALSEKVEKMQEEAKKLDKALADAHQQADISENKLATMALALDDARKKLADEQSVNAVEKTKYEALTEIVRQSEATQKEIKAALLKQQELLALEKNRSENLLKAISQYVGPASN